MSDRVSSPDRIILVRLATAFYVGGLVLAGAQLAFGGHGAAIPLGSMVVAGICLAFLLRLGAGLPDRAFDVLVVLGTLTVGANNAVAPVASDGALMFLWPALFSAYFFTARRAAFQVAVIAATHAVVLALTAPREGVEMRWFVAALSLSLATFILWQLRARMDRMVEQLAVMSVTDTLTGLRNRRGFSEGFRIEAARSQRENSRLAVVLFDLDHFKQVNDTHGHAVGDRVLVAMAEALTTCARESDVIARIGGEEFAVLLPGADDDGAESFAERTRAELVRLTADLGFTATASGGIVVAPPASLILDRLLAAADNALYAAKTAGRDQVKLALSADAPLAA